MDMPTNIDLNAVWRQMVGWLQTNVFSIESLVQIVLLVVLCLLSIFVWRGVRKKMPTVKGEWSANMLQVISTYGWSLIFGVLGMAAGASLRALGHPGGALDAFAHLGMAWFFVRVLEAMVPGSFWGRMLAWIIWGAAVLQICGLFDDAVEFLDGMQVSFGQGHISVLAVLKGLVVAGFLLQGASMLSRFLGGRIETANGISPSMRVLFSNTVRLGLFTTAAIVGLKGMGIDLTGLAVFSGAVGVGIGFGLQKVFSNLVSGVILLVDRSIKPGDTIEVGSAYGVVRSIQSRCVSVLTRDGKEYLIPNEELVTSQVINWTHSDNQVRLRIPVGISYECDPEKALKLMEDSAKGLPRVLRNPAPAARLRGFGESSVDLELRVWIADADMGVGGVQHEVLLAIWKAFQREGISLPFPQRDLYIKPGSSLSVKKEE